MKRIKVLLSLILVLAAGLVATGYASATPSAEEDKIAKDINTYCYWTIIDADKWYFGC